MHSSSTPIKALSPWTYVFSLLLWLGLCLTTAVIVIVLNIRDVEKQLAQYGDAFTSHLNQKMVSSETILKGFAALFDVLGNSDQAKLSRYVQQVIDSNSHVFSLEIVQQVNKRDLAKLAARMRGNGSPNFSVKSFAYDAGRKWLAVKDKDVYYPLIFIQPVRAGSEEVLGLDMDSVPFLQRTLTDALERRTAVVSHPFKLVEGNLAYVVFYPLPQNFQRNTSPVALAAQEQLIVDMVIDVGKLVDPSQFPVFNGEEVVVFHRDFTADDAKGQLFKRSGAARSVLETAIFPTFVYHKALATMDEPFALLIRRQVGWSDLSLGPLGFIAVMSLLSSMIVVAFLRVNHRSKILQLENQNRLWYLANHDTLTGLPNRLLLLDRLHQLLARALRQGNNLAVIFLDVDDFKIINDTYGHDVGDQVLRFVAERLQTAIRTEDTVARMSGDEFIILIENVESRASLESVKHKIEQKLSAGMSIAGEQIHVRTSIGVAMFPDDGGTPEALIKKADIGMYADKKDKSVRLRLV